MKSKLAIVAVLIATVMAALGIYYVTFLFTPPAPHVPPKITGHTGYTWKTDNLTFFRVDGEVQNTLETNIGSVMVNATFYDENNLTIGTSSARVELKIVEPKQKVPFRIYLSLDSLTHEPARYELVLSYVKTKEEAIVGLEIVDQTASFDEDGYHKVFGEVQNNGGRRAFAVTVFGTYYDSQGNVIGVSSAHASSVIDIGGRAIFELNSKPRKINPTSYELVVAAQGYGPFFISNLVILAILVAVFVAFVVYMKLRGW